MSYVSASRRPKRAVLESLAEHLGLPKPNLNVTKSEDSCSKVVQLHSWTASAPGHFSSFSFSFSYRLRSFQIFIFVDGRDRLFSLQPFPPEMQKDVHKINRKVSPVAIRVSKVYAQHKSVSLCGRWTFSFSSSSRMTA